MTSDNNPSQDTQLAVIATKMSYVQSDVSDIKHRLSQGYVTKEELAAKLEPLQRIVYGVVAAFTVAIVGAVVALMVTIG